MRNGRVRVVGYVSLSGEAVMFRKPMPEREGREMVAFWRRQEAEVVGRFRNGTADEFDEMVFGRLA